MKVDKTVPADLNERDRSTKDVEILSTKEEARKWI